MPADTTEARELPLPYCERCFVLGRARAAATRDTFGRASCVECVAEILSEGDAA